MAINEIHRTIYSKIEELPTLPAIVPRILSLVESEQSSIPSIAEAVSNDPALSATILKVANSAYYGFSKNITKLENAVGLLGLSMVRSLALSIGILNTLPASRAQINFSQEGLWKHSLGVATIMENLRSHLRKRRQDDHLFIVGLLHDTGKVVLDRFLGDRFRQALENTDREGRAVLHIEERQLIGFHHGDIGAMLLKRWQLPDVIIRPILLHHNNGPLEGDEGFDVAMLRLADALSYQQGLGNAGNPVGPEIGSTELEFLGMDERFLSKLNEKMETVNKSVKAFYDAVF